MAFGKRQVSPHCQKKEASGLFFFDSLFFFRFGFFFSSFRSALTGSSQPPFSDFYTAIATFAIFSHVTNPSAALLPFYLANFGLNVLTLLCL